MRRRLLPMTKKRRKMQKKQVDELTRRRWSSRGSPFKIAACGMDSIVM
jgi:hypothetical protein